jgi:hypothetical protein
MDKLEFVVVRWLLIEGRSSLVSLARSKIWHAFPGSGDYNFNTTSSTPEGHDMAFPDLDTRMADLPIKTSIFTPPLQIFAQ